jgi:hypothetical protein
MPTDVSINFEVSGYFETLYDPALNKVLGTRPCECESGRLLGQRGDKEIVITQDFTINAGHKKKLIRVMDRIIDS